MRRRRCSAGRTSISGGAGDIAAPGGRAWTMHRMLPDRRATLVIRRTGSRWRRLKQAASTAQRHGRCSSVAIGFGTPTCGRRLDVVPAIAVVVAQRRRLAGATHRERLAVVVEVTERVSQRLLRLQRRRARRGAPGTIARRAARVGNSGRPHSPPQMPLGGRRSSSTLLPRRASTTHASRCGRALRGFGAGYSALRVVAPGARMPALTGHNRQAGLRPRADRRAEIHDACVYSSTRDVRRACFGQRPEPALDCRFAGITRRPRSSAPARA